MIYLDQGFFCPGRVAVEHSAVPTFTARLRHRFAHVQMFMLLVHVWRRQKEGTLQFFAERKWRRIDKYVAT